LTLVAPVPVGGGRRQYLDHQIGRTPHILAAAQQMLAFPGDEQQVRLHDVGVGEYDVAGGKEELAERILPHESSQRLPQPNLSPLELQIRRRGHDQISIQQLVAPVRRRRAVVLAGELEGWLRRGHAGFPPFSHR
jgi:hypothetical protein